jgi:hypothetical protein
MMNYFPNFGYLTHKFSSEELQPLLTEVEGIQRNMENAVPYNKNLAGHLASEYELYDCRSYIEGLIFQQVLEYQKQTKYLDSVSILDKQLPLSLTNLWVNFQKKHEFNPVHNHAGLMSFVIWLKVPFKYEDEMKYFDQVKDGQNRTSTFSFLYNNALGDIATAYLPVDKTWENTLGLFPAKMNHCVYPFYSSDDYRITVSGNFKLTA